MNLLEKLTSFLKGGKDLTPKAEYNRMQNMRLAEGGAWWERPYWPVHTRNIDQEINTTEWKTLNSAANRLYWGFGAVRGAVDAFAQYTVGSSFSPIFQGADKEWGKEAEAWLQDWMQVAYVDGVSWHQALIREVVMMLRDGDAGTLLTASREGDFPMLQSIPWHAIGSRDASGIIKDGPYAGRQQVNGVVKNEMHRPIAYQILGDTKDTDRYIAAASMQLLKESVAPDQSRGFTAFASSIRDLRTVLNLNNHLRQAVELANTIGLVIENQMGMADPLDPAFALADVPPIGQSGLRVEERMSGTIQYFQAGANEKISQVINRTPSPETERFLERLIRNAMLGAGLDPEFFWKPEGTGANVRMIVEKTNRKINRTQNMLATACRQRVGYAVSKAIKSKMLPPYKGADKGGFLRWNFTRPRILTVDQGWADQSALNAYRGGLRTMTDIVGEGGFTLEEHLDLKEKEGIAIRERMERSGLPLDAFITLTPNGNPTGETNIQP
jgi:capsid protein